VVDEAVIVGNVIKVEVAGFDDAAADGVAAGPVAEVV
jgi:hypothetical protein